MTERERLIKLLEIRHFLTAETTADFLLDNGVKLPVTCGECVHCRDGMYSQECEEWGIYNDCCYTELDWWCSKGERRADDGT